MLPLKTQELINEQIATLPEYMQEALKNVAWQSELQKIAAKYRLDLDMANRFIVETSLLLIGVGNAVQYGQNLITEMGLDETLVKKMAPEIEERVFAPLQKYVLDNNQAEIQMLQEQVEILQQLAESDVDIFNDEEDSAFVDTESNLGENTIGTISKIQSDPYHEPVDPNDLVM